MQEKVEKLAVQSQSVSPVSKATCDGTGTCDQVKAPFAGRVDQSNASHVEWFHDQEKLRSAAIDALETICDDWQDEFEYLSDHKLGKKLHQYFEILEKWAHFCCGRFVEAHGVLFFLHSVIQHDERDIRFTS